MLDTLTECIKQADDEEEMQYIPKYVQTGCQSAVAEANVVSTDIDLILEDTWTPTPEFKMSTQNDKIKQVKATLKEMHRRLL
eukprot:4327842-Pyramimonas_sp.AAC.1